MYDSAKRSLAFTVATGGLLLTGTAYTPALAATGLSAPQGQAQAQGVQNDASASASSPVNTAGSQSDAAQSAPEGRAAQTPPDLLAPDVLHPNIPAPAPRAVPPGPGAAATAIMEGWGEEVIPEAEVIRGAAEDTPAAGKAGDKLPTTARTGQSPPMMSPF